MINKNLKGSKTGFSFANNQVVGKVYIVFRQYDETSVIEGVFSTNKGAVKLVSKLMNNDNENDGVFIKEHEVYEE